MKHVSFLVALLILSVAACSGRSTKPDTTDSTTPAVITEQGIVFTGKSDSADLTIRITDDYLKTVLNGNPYQYNGSGYTNLDLFYQVHSELKISGLNYPGSDEAVDIICEYNEPSNHVDLFLKGTAENGHTGAYLLGTDSVFYFMDDINSQVSIQGENDEITEFYASGIAMFGNPEVTFELLCNGSDNNEYTATIHSN
ncbi:MAG: hypothetical protein V1647_03890, partial [Pseudomonadota bacterium]